MCVSFVYSNDYGCTDQNACNYDINATEDDGSCLYLDCLNECGGLNYDCCDDPNSEDFSNCPIDCTGCLGGNAYIDECGNCVGGTTSDEQQDCGSTPCLENWAMDCNGECYGDAFFDDCGVCSGENVDHVANSDKDCNADCFGDAFFDDCGVCSGGNSNHTPNSDIDCNGECFGDAQLDACGECDNNSNNDNQTCSGCTNLNACNFNSEALFDDGSCLYFDCAGVCGGDALIDDCGTCTCLLDGISASAGCGFGVIQDYNGDDVGCGCSGNQSGIDPNYFYYDEDLDGLGYGESEIYCTEFDLIVTDNTIYDLAPDGWVLNSLDDCPLDANDDSDEDGSCDSDDICPGEDDFLDTDEDTVVDCLDDCPLDANDDSDGDVRYDDICPGEDD